MRVLILADDCNPDWPSLPVVGYKAARALSERVDVVVATHVRNRDAIERDGLGQAEVAYMDNEYVAAPMFRMARLLRGGTQVGWTTGIAMRYLPQLAFEREVWKRFRDDLESGRFDVVHRITPMSPTLPSPMAAWSPVPFVLGPLNGGLKWPASFGTARRREKEWLTYIRNAYRLLPYYRKTYRRTAAVLASFDHTVADLPASCHDRVVRLAEVGIDPDVFGSPGARTAGDRVTFLYVGRLVPYKCPDVAVEAFAASERLRRHRLVIIGDGPERERIEALIEQYGLHDSVELRGRVTQAEVGDAMREADVFVFPSIRELGAGVVVEAMACGLACVVVDYGGPGGLVGPSTGVRVPLGDRETLVRHFAAEMETLADDPGRIETIGRNAHEFALREYAWSAKAAKTIEVYEWVLGRRPGRPDFDTPIPREDAVGVATGGSAEWSDA